MTTIVAAVFTFAAISFAYEYGHAKGRRDERDARNSRIIRAWYRWRDVLGDGAGWDRACATWEDSHD